MNRSAFITSLLRRCPYLTEDEAELVAKDADEYAAWAVEQWAHPPVGKPLRFGYAPPKGNRSHRSGEKAAADG